MSTIVDDELKEVYRKAMNILKEHQKYLLKYNDETCLSKAMYTIKAVIVNKRSNTSRRGCCKYNRAWNSCTIEISEYMLSLNEDEILTTMIHELLHAFKDSKNHTGQWAWRAKYLKEQTGLNIQRVRSIEGESLIHKKQQEIVSDKPWMDTYKCKDCGREVVKSKNSKFAKYYNLYTCGHCRGHFEKVNKKELV